MNIFIHIGYSKTGTSFLQKKIFPYFNEIKYIGKFISKNISDDQKVLNQIHNDITLMDDDEFDKNKMKIFEYLKKYNDLKTNILISDENFLCSQINTLDRNIDWERTIERLYSTYSKIGNVIFVCVFRNQSELIKSLYMQLAVNWEAIYNISLDDLVYHFKENKKIVKINKKNNFFSILNFFEIKKHFKDKNYNFNYFLFEEIFENQKNFLQFLNFFSNTSQDHLIGKINNKINTSNDKQKKIPSRIIKKIKENFQYLNLNNINEIPKKINTFITYFTLGFKLKKNGSKIISISNEIKKHYQDDLYKFNDKEILDKFKKYNYL